MLFIMFVFVQGNALVGNAIRVKHTKHQTGCGVGSKELAFS